MNNVIEILKKVQAITVDSHIVLTSGRHSYAYINPDALLPHTQECSMIGEIYAKEFVEFDIDVVVGPAYGGIILSQWAAYHLSLLKKKYIPSLFTEKTPDKRQIFERGFDKIVKDKKVLVVEDIVATGGSVKKAVDSVTNAGGKVVVVGVMVNRDPDNVTSQTVGAQLRSLSVFKIDSYEATACPLCKKNIPINTEVGHGKEYLQAKENK